MVAHRAPIISAAAQNNVPAIWEDDITLTRADELIE